jgi:hypothetical protein
MDMASEDGVEFVLIAEAGVLEAQALLLCESIRHFAGAYGRAPVTVVSPRSSSRPSQSTQRKLKQLDAEYLPLEIDSCCPEYGPSYRVHSVAEIERRPGPPVIVQVDSDTIFLGEPDLSLADGDLAARPVDVKGMCTTGPGDPFDGYWRELCALVGVDYNRLPFVATTIDRHRVRASYNAGFVAAKRACGVFKRTEEVFRRLVAANLMPWPDGPAIMTGTGLLTGPATAYWGTSQAAISVAAVAGNHAVRLLPETHNIPLHLFEQLTSPNPAQWTHVHYHWLFSAAASGANPMQGEKLALPPQTREWLRSRVPLHY